MTLDRWEKQWEEATRAHDFSRIAIHWHDGQWSGLYRLQCNGRVLDIGHATAIWRETNIILRQITARHVDAPALRDLNRLTDIYPDPEDLAEFLATAGPLAADLDTADADDID